MIDVGLLFDLQPPAVHLPTLLCVCVFVAILLLKIGDVFWCV